MIKNGTFLHLEPQGLGEWDKYEGDVYFTTLGHHLVQILAPKTKKEHIFFLFKNRNFWPKMGLDKSVGDGAIWVAP